MYVGRSDDASPACRFGVILIHIERIHVTSGLAKFVDGLFGQGVRNGLAGLTRDDVIPNFSGRISRPEISVVLVIQGILRQQVDKKLDKVTA